MTSLNLKYYKEILAKNEDRIILIIGFILVAFLSFGAGKLSETYHPQTPIIFNNASKCGTAHAATGAASDSANSQSDNPIAANGAQIQERIIGNKKSMIYHVHGDAFYDKIGAQNRIYFNSEQDAQNAGYRKSRQ